MEANNLKAIEWWNSLSFNEKVKKKFDYFDRELLFFDLTEMDIEEMYIFYHLQYERN